MLNRRSLLLLSLMVSGLVITGVLFAEPQANAEVEIKDYKFIPQEITIKAGDTVRWTNREKRQYHSVWFEQAGDLEAPYIFPDETTTRKFESTGSFPYRCGPHPEMTGIVHVK